MKKEIKKIIVKSTVVAVAATLSRKLGESVSIKILDKTIDRLNK